MISCIFQLNCKANVANLKWDSVFIQSNRRESVGQGFAYEIHLFGQFCCIIKRYQDTREERNAGPLHCAVSPRLSQHVICPCSFLILHHTARKNVSLHRLRLHVNRATTNMTYKEKYCLTEVESACIHLTKKKKLK